jgi:hypothetical protein
MEVFREVDLRQSRRNGLFVLLHSLLKNNYNQHREKEMSWEEFMGWFAIAVYISVILFLLIYIAPIVLKAVGFIR